MAVCTFLTSLSLYIYFQAALLFFLSAVLAGASAENAYPGFPYGLFAKGYPYGGVGLAKGAGAVPAVGVAAYPAYPAKGSPAYPAYPAKGFPAYPAKGFPASSAKGFAAYPAVGFNAYPDKAYGAYPAYPAKRVVGYPADKLAVYPSKGVVYPGVGAIGGASYGYPTFPSKGGYPYPNPYPTKGGYPYPHPYPNKGGYPYPRPYPTKGGYPYYGKKIAIPSVGVAQGPFAAPFAPAVGVDRLPVAVPTFRGVAGAKVGKPDPLAFDAFGANFGLGDFFGQKH